MNVIIRRPAGVLALSIVLTASSIDAQRPTTDTFEVVSIKPRTGDRVGTLASAPDRFIRPDTTILQQRRTSLRIPSAVVGAASAFADTSNLLERIQPGPPSIWKS